MCQQSHSQPCHLQAQDSRSRREGFVCIRFRRKGIRGTPDLHCESDCQARGRRLLPATRVCTTARLHLPSREWPAVLKTSAKYHFDSDHRKKDVGFHFKKAFVLVSDDFRYLGQKGTDDYKKRYPKVRRLIEDLTQGHRRYHSAKLRNELMALKAAIWRKYRRMKVGRPTENDRSRPCNQDSPSASC